MQQRRQPTPSPITRTSTRIPPPTNHTIRTIHNPSQLRPDRRTGDGGHQGHRHSNQDPEQCQFQYLAVTPIKKDLEFIDPHNTEANQRQLALTMLTNRRALYRQKRNSSTSIRLTTNTRSLILSMAIIRIMLQLGRNSQMRIMTISSTPNFLRTDQAPLFKSTMMRRLTLNSRISRATSTSHQKDIQRHHPGEHLHDQED